VSSKGFGPLVLAVEENCQDRHGLPPADDPYDIRMKKQQQERTYFTGLVTTVDELQEYPPPFKGAGWSASDVEQRARESTLKNGREIAIHARCWRGAQRALNLIISCLLVRSGGPPLYEIHPVAHNDEEPDFLNSHARRTKIRELLYSTTGIPSGCRMAAKASRRRNWVYALAHYKFSVSVYGTHAVDMEPHFSQHLPISVFPDDHVMFSHAILSAYCAIENLGLELRASQTQPSMIAGKWNPRVRKRLEDRLTKAGVDLNEPILWILRGAKRRTERKKEMPALSKARWAGGPVRDSEVRIVDAIAYASWLRSHVASHKVKDLTKSLSPYDVENVQHLARRLLLEVLGYWR